MDVRIFVGGLFYIFVSLVLPVKLSAQLPEPIINNQEILNEINEGLNYVYNCDFENAVKTYDYLKKKRPDHPVTPFFYGLAVYWDNYPLIDGSDNSLEFIKAMEKTIELSEPLWENDANNIEGVFFELVSRAMLMMHYSDKGHSGKVLKLAPATYRHLLKSYELKELFKEFYFITGLYNYYIVTYPEKNPVYKPITFMFKSGNKKEGLRELHYTLDSTIFMKNEGAMFLAIIYYDFERKTDTAIKIMERLTLQYPENAFFASQYIEYLLSEGYYEKCIPLNQAMVKKNRKNAYIVMKAIIFKAIIEEKYKNNYGKAKKDYELGLKIADSFETMGNDFKSYALFGLSRIEKMNGDMKSSKEYERKAKELSRYGHFTN